jgi:amidase
VDRALADAGCKVIELGPEFAKAWEEATKNGQVIAVADGYTSDRHLLDQKGVTGTTKIALLLGDLRKDSSSYDKALRERPLWRATIQRVLRNVDFIALPTLKTPPYRIPIWGRFATFESRALGMQNTVAVNYAGNPAIAIPIPMEGEKVTLTSLQLVGREKSEPELLNAARILTSKKE